MPLPSNSASVPSVRVVYPHDGVEREDAGTPGAQPSRRGALRSVERVAPFSAYTRWDTSGVSRDESRRMFVSAPERRVARRAHTRSGRASRFPRSWRGQRPTRPRSPCRSSPSWPDVRGPRQTAAVIRHDSHRRYPIASTPKMKPLFRRGAHHASRVGRPACRHPLAPRPRGGK